MRRLILLLCGLCAGAQAWPAAVEQTWRAVLFDGRKVGWSLTEREVLADGSIRSAEVMDLTIQRENVSISMHSREETTESESGEPLGFRAEIRTAGQELSYVGTPSEGREFSVQVRSAGSERTQTLQIPDHALFFEGRGARWCRGCSAARRWWRWMPSCPASWRSFRWRPPSSRGVASS